MQYLRFLDKMKICGGEPLKVYVKMYLRPFVKRGPGILYILKGDTVV
jgi:hypothetical protein